ncbi:hypothetical protein GH741_16525 [Aquibacillus halophilus]|uniref:Uncharacterized protein n=1 Tax=Aquibacillus halophilus TaxID=930132 RepID=A0A6A8DGA1_9BACI|nr:hypothetical protein [Aquibacillus halophilus]MRH44250.1 hypothetical protein [Aquibacillus halophilus]
MKIFKHKQTIYELFMVLLASLSIATIWNNTGYNSFIVWITWGIFAVDFAYRLYKSDNRWQYIKSNPFLLIAAIPLDAMFQLARFARILHLLRLKTITKYYTMPFMKLLKKQNMFLVSSIAILILLLSDIPLYLIESKLTSYWHALGTSLMSLTFFGQSDFEPTTVYAHILIVVLTIIGVILHGFVISTTIDLVYQSSWFSIFRRKTRLKKGSESK